MGVGSRSRSRVSPGAHDRGRRLVAPVDGRGRVHQLADRRPDLRRARSGLQRGRTGRGRDEPAVARSCSSSAGAVFGAFASIEWIALARRVSWRRSPRSSSAATRRGSCTAASDGVVVPGRACSSSPRSRSSGTSRRRASRWASCGCGSPASWCALMTAARSDEITGRRRLGCCVVLGLAPLVRPELTLDDAVPARRRGSCSCDRAGSASTSSRSSRCPSRTRSSAWATTRRSCPTPRSPRTRAACT